MADTQTVTTEAFFGFMGVTCALVFASRALHRPGIGLRHCEEWSRHRLYGRPEA